MIATPFIRHIHVNIKIITPSLSNYSLQLFLILQPADRVLENVSVQLLQMDDVTI